MVVGRCAGQLPDGRPCHAWPLRGEGHCLWHSPERAEEAAEARRLGGLRRRREGTLALAYELPGLDSVAGIRRLLEVVVVDGLGSEQGIARLRVLIAAAGAADDPAGLVRPVVPGAPHGEEALVPDDLADDLEADAL